MWDSPKEVKIAVVSLAEDPVQVSREKAGFPLFGKRRSSLRGNARCW
jgi:hypothetical protein